MNQLLLEIIRQKRIVLVLIMSLIVVNVAFLLLINSYQEPSLDAYRSKWSELRSLAARAGHADAAALHRQAMADLEKLNTRIPLKREFARVLSELLTTGSNDGVVTGAISYRPLTIKDENLLSYQLSFSVNGDYAAVKSFLSDIQKNPELIVINSVTFTNSDLFVEDVVMNLKITVYLREGA